MDDRVERTRREARALPLRVQLRIVALAAGAFALLAGTVFLVSGMFSSGKGADEAPTIQNPTSFKPTAQQLAALEINPVEQKVFHTETMTDGYVALDGGFEKPAVSATASGGSDGPLLGAQATDVIQAESDLMTAKAQFNLAQTDEARQRNLYRSEGAALKDWQQSQVALATASAALGSARNRLRVLGKGPQEIAALEDGAQDVISKQSNSHDGSKAIVPSTVWLVANIREADTARIHIGDKVEAHVLAFPDAVFQATVSYISPVIDAVTHRLVVGAEVGNEDGRLKPQMSATLKIISGSDSPAPTVPDRAIVHEGDKAHVWVADKDGSLAARDIVLGRANGDLIEVLKGLKPGERVVTGGSIFIDRAAVSS